MKCNTSIDMNRNAHGGRVLRLFRRTAALLVLICAVPAMAEDRNTLKDRWTSGLKEYVQHTSHEKYYLEQIAKINSSNADSVLPSQLAASYYPMCKMFTERGEFLVEVLFARRMFNEIKKNAKTRSDFLMMAKYANSAALSYTALKFYDEAQGMFDKGTAIARKYGFKEVLSHIYTNRAQLYYDTEEYAKSLSLLAELEKLTGTNGIVLNNMALVCYKQKKMDDAVSYFDSALRHAAGNDEQTVHILINKGEILTEMSRFDEAEECLAAAGRLLKDSSPAVLRLMTQLNFAKLYIAQGHMLKASAVMKHIEKRVMPKLSDAIKGTYLKDIAGLYIKLNDYAKASKYLEESIRLNDSLNYDKQKRQLFQMMTWYDIAQLRNDNMQLKNEYEMASAKLRNRTVMAVATVLVALLLAVLVVIVVRKRKTERKKNAIIIEQERKLRMLRQKEYEWEKSKMEGEISRKSRELTLFSIDLSSIDNLHKNICDELAELASDTGEEDTRRRINAMSLKLRKQTACSLSEGFKKYFSEVSPMFNSRLKEAHPSLTSNDQRLCAYIYMGLTSKEISQITFREVESVEKSRNRLRKKISLPSDISIREYLSSIIDENHGSY